MCLIAVAFHQHHEAPLIVVSNRDEYYARPTRDMHWWDDAPILAGRDLQMGGTWMGVTRGGRFAAITNYRNVPADGKVPARPLSRGNLVKRFLCARDPAERWARNIRPTLPDYGEFNLLVHDGRELLYLNNYHDDEARRLEPGFYALSNSLLDSPWPKVDYARDRLRDSVEQAAHIGEDEIMELLDNLALQQTYAPHLLPRTGVPQEWEEILSSPFIVAPGYGTRASTVLVMFATGEVKAVERNFEAGRKTSEQRFDFRVEYLVSE